MSTLSSLPFFPSQQCRNFPAPPAGLSSILRSSSADCTSHVLLQAGQQAFSQTELQRGTHKRLAASHREELGSPSLSSHSPQLPRAASALSCSSFLYSHILVLAPPAWPCSGYPGILPWAPELHQQEQFLAEASPGLLLYLLLAPKLSYTLYTQFTYLFNLFIFFIKCLLFEMPRALSDITVVTLTT